MSFMPMRVLLLLCVACWNRAEMDMQWSTHQIDVDSLSASNSNLFGLEVCVSDNFMLSGSPGSASAIMYTRVSLSAASTAGLQTSVTPTFASLTSSVSSSGGIYEPDSILLGPDESSLSWIYPAYTPVDMTEEELLQSTYSSNQMMWTQQSILVASDSSSTSQFGHAMDLTEHADGPDVAYAVVSAYYSESAYIFSNQQQSTSVEGWTQQAKLVASDAASAGSAYFGISASISYSDQVIDDQYTLNALIGTTSGACVYLFTSTVDSSNTILTEWTQQMKLIPSDTAFSTSYLFGKSLKIRGDQAIIGAQGYTGGSGAAYIFAPTDVESIAGMHTSWAQQIMIIPPEQIPGAKFGYSVDIATDMALVGSCYSSGSTSAGTACTYRNHDGYMYDSITSHSWSFQSQLVANKTAAGDGYGCNVALSQENEEQTNVHVAAIASPYYNNNEGLVSVFSFKYSALQGGDGLLWQQEVNVQPLMTSGNTQYSQFGVGGLALSNDGKNMIVGYPPSYLTSGVHLNPGLVFTFHDRSIDPVDTSLLLVAVNSIAMAVFIILACCSSLCCGHYVRKGRIKRSVYLKVVADRYRLESAHTDADSFMSSIDLGRDSTHMSNISYFEDVDASDGRSGLLSSHDGEGQEELDYESKVRVHKSRRQQMREKRERERFSSSHGSNKNKGKDHGDDGDDGDRDRDGDDEVDAKESAVALVPMTPRGNESEGEASELRLSTPPSSPSRMTTSYDKKFIIEKVNNDDDNNNAGGDNGNSAGDDIVVGERSGFMVEFRYRDYLFDFALHGITTTCSYCLLYILSFREATVMFALLLTAHLLLVIVPFGVHCVTLRYPKWIARSVSSNIRKYHLQIFHSSAHGFSRNDYVTLFCMLAFSMNLIRYLPWRQTMFSVTSRGYPTYRCFKYCEFTDMVLALMYFIAQWVLLLTASLDPAPSNSSLYVDTSSDNDITEPQRVNQNLKEPLPYDLEQQRSGFAPMQLDIVSSGGWLGIIHLFFLTIKIAVSLQYYLVPLLYKGRTHMMVIFEIFDFLNRQVKTYARLLCCCWYYCIRRLLVTFHLLTNDTPHQQDEDYHNSMHADHHDRFDEDDDHDFFNQSDLEMSNTQLGRAFALVTATDDHEKSRVDRMYHNDSGHGDNYNDDERWKSASPVRKNRFLGGSSPPRRGMKKAARTTRTPGGKARFVDSISSDSDTGSDDESMSLVQKQVRQLKGASSLQQMVQNSQKKEEEIEERLQAARGNLLVNNYRNTTIAVSQVSRSDNEVRDIVDIVEVVEGDDNLEVL